MPLATEPLSKRRKPNDDEAFPENVLSMNHDSAVSATVTPTKTPEERHATELKAAIDKDTNAQYSVEIQDVTRNNEVNKPTDEEKDEKAEAEDVDNMVVKLLLQDLRLARSYHEAKEAINKLFQHLHTDDAKVYDPRQTTDSYRYTDEISRPVAKFIAKYDGVFAIFMALNDFLDDSRSHTFACKAVRLLNLISGLVPEAARQLIKCCAIRSLVKLASREVDAHYCQLKNRDRLRGNFEYSKQSNMVGILWNLVDTLSWKVCKETVTEETLDFVISAIKKYPEDEYTQEVGINYLIYVGKTGDSALVKMLQEKKVCHLFVEALDQFRNKSVRVKEKAQEAMALYAHI
ncbi:unnamed protein product [Cylindrotheca closterium]|uniref:Uncharacterized protein n=1 Tax=Cylindrotheca closterium TaxID=2856 RepID=A0AAD2JML0_9STRA|nr:unnamed protein product [Cylindrotheca closterium]